MCFGTHPHFFLVHHADARGGSQRGGYRRKYRDGNVQNLLPDSFLFPYLVLIFSWLVNCF